MAITPQDSVLMALGLQTSGASSFDVPAGTTTKAPMRLTAGSLTTVPLDGALEYDGNHLYFTIGTIRYQIDQQSSPAPVFTITAFGGPPAQEVGQELDNPPFTASYSETPDTAGVIDDQGNPAEDVSTHPTSFNYANSYTKTANNAAVIFTLNATSGAVPATKDAAVAWRPRAYYGVGPDGLSTEADIEGLATSLLAASRALTFSVAPGVGEHIYYAYPASYGAATFHVDGWEGGFDLVADDISVTNDYGVTQNYRLYRSTNPNLGSITVQVT